MEFIIHKYFGETNIIIPKIVKSYYIQSSILDITFSLYRYLCIYFNKRYYDLGIFLDMIQIYLALRGLKKLTSHPNINQGIILLYSFNLISNYYSHITSLTRRIYLLAITQCYPYIRNRFSNRENARNNDTVNDTVNNTVNNTVIELTEETLNKKAPLKFPGINNPNNPNNPINEEDQCSICLEKIEKRIARKLPCNHVYHARCIEDWVIPRNNKCPLCRQRIV